MRSYTSEKGTSWGYEEPDEIQGGKNNRPTRTKEDVANTVKLRGVSKVMMDVVTGY